MRFEIVTFFGVLVTCAFFPEGVRAASAGEDVILRKRLEEAQWLLTKIEDGKLKLQNEIEILTRRAAAPDLLKRLGKVDMTQGYNLPKSRGVQDGVGYNIAWTSDESGNEQNLHKNGALKITVEDYDQSGKKVSPEKKDQIKKKVEAKIMGDI